MAALSAAVVMLIRATGSDKPYDSSRSAMGNDTYSIESKGKRFQTAILKSETFSISYAFQSIAKLLSHNNGHYRHCHIGQYIVPPYFFTSACNITKALNFSVSLINSEARDILILALLGM
jgi:hypothetical protein